MLWVVQCSTEQLKLSRHSSIPETSCSIFRCRRAHSCPQRSARDWQKSDRRSASLRWSSSCEDAATIPSRTVFHSTNIRSRNGRRVSGGLLHHCSFACTGQTSIRSSLRSSSTGRCNWFSLLTDRVHLQLSHASSLPTCSLPRSARAEESTSSLKSTVQRS